MGKREAQIEKPLVKRIKAIGGEIRKSVWVAHKGCPDRRVMLPQAYREHVYDQLPKALRDTLWPQNPWVEAKRADGDPEGHQAREHGKMRRLGELVLVIDSLELIDRYFPLVLPDAEA